MSDASASELFERSGGRDSPARKRDGARRRRAAQDADEQPTHVNSQARLAKAIGVDPSRIARWKKGADNGKYAEPFPQRDDEGRWCVADVEAWATRNLSQAPTPRGHVAGEPIPLERLDEGGAVNAEQDEPTESQIVQLELKKEELRARTLKNDEAEGKVVKIDAVKRALIMRAHTLTRKLESADARVAGELPEPYASQVRRRLDEERSRALEEYADADGLLEPDA